MHMLRVFVLFILPAWGVAVVHSGHERVAVAPVHPQQERPVAVQANLTSSQAALHHLGEGGFSPIVVAESSKRWWGLPNYHRDHEFGMRTWQEFNHEMGRYGRLCEESRTQQQCGFALICRNGTCGGCAVSRDCGEHFRCEAFPRLSRNMCVPRDLSRQWSWGEVTCTILVIITAVLSAAAGMGGGGVYVPLMLLLLDLSTKEAVPLSQVMILGGAIVNVVMFCGDRHPKYPNRPRIDYDVVMMLQPGLAAGVTLGVVVHIMSPQWLIVSILIVTLVLALQKSLTKGVQQWQKESQLLREAALDSEAGARCSPSNVKMKFLTMADMRSFACLVRDNQRACSLIAGCWLLMLGLNLFKAPKCSTFYWMQLMALLAVCVAFTRAGAQSLLARAASKSDGAEEEGLLSWTPRTLWMYPLFSTAAGFLGGLLGIGGGIILGPLLLELGLLPEANQATTAAFVFLSSSLATIQFVVLGKAMPQYIFWFAPWVLVATLVGQTCVDYALKRWQRSSLIVLSVAGIIAGSLLMMSLIGIMNIVSDILRGAGNMGFNPQLLCQ
mmetsp:Transcript_56420/g.104420  ORF Transcript_56420/g.104420 Transcript_56420/m.104420 type:complete len:554 (+) Transcript_56420:113-1774(+)